MNEPTVPGANIPALAGYPVDASPLPPPALLDQRWSELSLIHWPVETASVAHLFPPGTRPDVFADGLTYGALVPFLMSGIRLGCGGPGYREHARRQPGDRLPVSTGTVGAFDRRQGAGEPAECCRD